MKNQIFMMILMALCQVRLFSQQYDCKCDGDEEAYNTYLQNTLVSREYSNPIPRYRGEQYLSDWTRGEVILRNGETVRNMDLRYERYMDEVLWLRSGDFRIGVLNKRIIEGFRLQGEDGSLSLFFVKKRIKLPATDSLDAYLQVLVEGPVSLFAYRNVVRVLDRNATTDNTLYFIEAGGFLQGASLTNKSLKKLPGVDRVTMKEILRSQGISVRGDETKAARALTLYNQEIK